MARLAAVTGATGFLGRYIVGALATAGWRVRILARRQPDHPQLAHLEFETIRGDLSDGHALRELVEGADTVIHAAALIKARSAAAFRAVNVGGTVNLAKALNECRHASSVVLVSSMAAREPQLSAERTRSVSSGFAKYPCIMLGPRIMIRPTSRSASTAPSVPRISRS